MKAGLEPRRAQLNMIGQIKVTAYLRGVSRTSDVARPVYTVDT